MMGNKDSQNANSRIAKNTILLYIRMILLMLISLYTSRVILSTLGIEDYGLYNVVGGIVTMFTFLSSAMGNSSQRFITYALGKGDADELKRVFNTTCLVHWVIAIIILFLSETVGLWFLYNKMVIPVERFSAAVWVYQFSIISCVVSVISIPYNALVIAHEKMGAFSFISILYAIVKLGIVFIVQASSSDKLILYAALLLIAQIAERLVYQFYCRSRFFEAKHISFRNCNQTKEMLGFAGWSLLPNLATVCYSQGINIILNLFFGPAVNAARGVSVQVQGIVKNFVTNFQTAVTPQIIKSYASNDVDRLNKLVFNSSKLSFYLLLCIALPVFIEAEYLLDIWLKDVPEHTVSFLRLILLAILLDPLANPLCVANNATGDIKKFKMWEAGICVSVIPIGYILLKLGLRPESVFVAQIILSGIVQFARVALSRGFLHFTFKTYLKNVIYYVIGVILIAPISPLLLYHFLPKGFGSFLLVSAVCVLSVVVCSYFIGFNASERETIRYKVSNFLMRR